MVTFRAQRQARLMSIRDVATAGMVSPQTVVNVESGKRVPRPSTMRQLAAALGVEPAEIDEFAAAIKEWTDDPA